jgi:cation transport regulator ChaC
MGGPAYAGGAGTPHRARHRPLGRNTDYLRDLVEHLRALGVRDPTMEALLLRVETLEAAS